VSAHAERARTCYDLNLLSYSSRNMGLWRRPSPGHRATTEAAVRGRFIAWGPPAPQRRCVAHGTGARAPGPAGRYHPGSGGGSKAEDSWPTGPGSFASWRTTCHVLGITSCPFPLASCPSHGHNNGVDLNDAGAEAGKKWCCVGFCCCPGAQSLHVRLRDVRVWPRVLHLG
jgi:hypothetical protein